MRTITKYLILYATVLVSCTGNSNKQHRTPDSTAADSLTTVQNADRSNVPLCFIRTEGNEHQDTTKVRLLIEGNRVTGDMDWIPSEKDSRRGKLQGTISDGEITATWKYIQEGIQDSMQVMFRLSPNQLVQKPLKVDSNTGRQQTDTAASYTWTYMPLEECDPL